MAQRTYLQMVGDEELAALKADPESINALDKSDDESAGTYYWTSLAYFVCGSAYPEGSRGPLAAAFTGTENVECKSLENGSFDVVSATAVREAASALADLDRGDFRRKVARADHEELVEEEELYDLEHLIAEGEDIADTLSEELEMLEQFFTAAAERNASIAMYTT